MRKEHSYGIIPLRKENKNWKVLLIQHGAGHWAFPKGHAEKGEVPLETAARELFEETSLIIKELLSTEPLQEHYIFQREGELVTKTVDYYLALVEGEVVIDPKEIGDFKWVKIEEAPSYVTFKASQELCKQVEALLKELFIDSQ